MGIGGAGVRAYPALVPGFYPTSNAKKKKNKPTTTKTQRAICRFICSVILMARGFFELPENIQIILYIELSYNIIRIAPNVVKSWNYK